MKSSQSNSTEHLGAMRQRRIARMKRQRAIEAGKPVDTSSLKAMALSSVQKEELSGLQPRTHDTQKHRVATHRRVSVVGSLVVHAIAVFIAAFYVVRTAQVDDESVIVDFFDIPKERPPTDRPPMVKQPKPINTVPEKPDLIVKPPVQPLTPENETVLAEDGLEGFDDPEPIISTGIDPGSVGQLEGFGPIKISPVDTGKPEDLFPTGSGDDGLDIINEPPDVDNTPDPDLMDGNAFKPQKVIRLPRWRKKVDPKYPSSARRAQKEGRVVLVFSIDEDGKAKDIRVKEDKTGFGLARAAVEALEASRFTSAKQGEERGTKRYSMAYQFKLED